MDRESRKTVEDIEEWGGLDLPAAGVRIPGSLMSYDGSADRADRSKDGRECEGLGCEIVGRRGDGEWAAEGVFDQRSVLDKGPGAWAGCWYILAALIPTPPALLHIYYTSHTITKLLRGDHRQTSVRHK